MFVIHASITIHPYIPRCGLCNKYIYMISLPRGSYQATWSGRTGGKRITTRDPKPRDPSLATGGASRIPPPCLPSPRLHETGRSRRRKGERAGRVGKSAPKHPGGGEHGQGRTRSSVPASSPFFFSIARIRVVAASRGFVMRWIMHRRREKKQKETLLGTGRYIFLLLSLGFFALPPVFGNFLIRPDDYPPPLLLQPPDQNRTVEKRRKPQTKT